MSEALMQRSSVTVSEINCAKTQRLLGQRYSLGVKCFRGKFVPPSKRWEKVYHLIPLLRNTPGICEAALRSGNSMLHTWNASQIHFLTVDMEGCQM